jgi:peroxiredoxin
MAPSSQSRRVSITNYLVLALVFVLLAGALLVRFVGEDNPESAGLTDASITTNLPTSDFAREGAAAPDFSLLDIDGNPVTLSEWKGRPVLMNFWATWCGPCEVEMPAIQAAYLAHQDKGLIVLAVAVDDSVENVRRFFEEHNLDFVPLMDDGNVARSYQVFGLPTSYFIGPDGTVIAAHTGVLTEDKISAYLSTVAPQ